jgi:hypothetical protein
MNDSRDERSRLLNFKSSLFHRPYLGEGGTKVGGQLQGHLKVSRQIDDAVVDAALIKAAARAAA